jgi:hypothetical protein
MEKRTIRFRVYKEKRYYVSRISLFIHSNAGEVVENINAIEHHLEGEDLEELGISSPYFL